MIRADQIPAGIRNDDGCKARASRRTRHPVNTARIAKFHDNQNTDWNGKVTGR
jgi:hypothetical protein